MKQVAPFFVCCKRIGQYQRVFSLKENSVSFTDVNGMCFVDCETLERLEVLALLCALLPEFIVL